MRTRVIVVGAGPVGLLLAGELRLGGAEVTVYDRLPAPTGESRALGFNRRAAESLGQRGLLPGLGGFRWGPMGHFGGVRFDLGMLAEDHSGVLGLSQARTEAMLGDWLAGLGVPVRRGYEVVGLREIPDGVVATVEGPAGAGEVTARYLVGCDGEGSTVRALAGIEAPGRESTRTMYTAEVTGVALRPRPIGERLPGGNMVVCTPLGDGRFRVVIHDRSLPARPEPGALPFPRVADAWQRLTGESIHDARPLWTWASGNASRLAAQYRRGRVFLAGDAAHEIPPLAAWGLSAGLQDAANLGWKLAAAVRGWAPNSLLNTYHAERHPVGQHLLRNARAASMLYLGDAGMDPLRSVLGELVAYPDAAGHLAGIVSGLGIRYDLAPGDHPLLGRRLPPDRTLTRPDGTTTTVADLLHPARGVLITTPTTHTTATGWTDRIHTITTSPPPTHPRRRPPPTRRLHRLDLPRHPHRPHHRPHPLVRPGPHPRRRRVAGDQRRRRDGGAGMSRDVIVVGAGPVGLMTAGELRLGGADVVVYDKLPAPPRESRGASFTRRTAECFAQRGLLDRLGPTERADSHFGGVPIDLGLFEEDHFAVRGVSQFRTERMLEGWVAELGVPVRRGHEVTGFHETADGVVVDLDGPAGPGQDTARYLVGCDGGRSTIRTLAGIDFPGPAPTRGFYTADVTGLETRRRRTGENLPGGSMVMAMDLENGVTRVVVHESGMPPKDRDSLSYTELADAWQRLTGESIHHGQCRWLSCFTDASRVATEYRRGRVFLAGDATHVQPPAMAQGLSVGVQDAVNLGWKLAAAVRGRAPDGLLDTYHAERHPVGQQLARNARAAIELRLTGESMDPVRSVLSELVAHRDAAEHLAGMLSGLGIRYDLAPGDHPLLGRRLPPDRTLTRPDGTTTTVADLLHPARGVLITTPTTHTTATGWTDRIHTITTTHPPDPTLDAVLLRPDGYIAWTSPGTHTDLTTALTRWFGPAA